MSTYITPTLTIASNASSASNNPGPLSVALSLSATDLLTIDNVSSGIYTLAGTASEATLFDGSTFGQGLGGTVGGFIYLKNTHATALIYVGVIADDASAADLDGSAEATRLLTLKTGEFAWFPFDYNMDITIDTDTAGATLEWWRFDRG